MDFTEQETDARQNEVGVVVISVCCTLRLVPTAGLAASLLLHTRDDLQDVLLQGTLQVVAALLKADLLRSGAVLALSQAATLPEEDAVAPQ